MSCYTPYCWGDREQCQAQAKFDKEQEEANARCPYRKECNVRDINVKTDQCSTCGKTWNY